MRKPTCSKSSNRLICPLVVGSTAPRVELLAARSFKSSSSRRVFFFSFLSNTPDFSRSKSIRASESYYKNRSLRLDKTGGVVIHGNLPPTSFCRLRSPPSAVLPLHPFEPSQCYLDGKDGMICDERYLVSP